MFLEKNKMLSFKKKTLSENKKRPILNQTLYLYLFTVLLVILAIGYTAWFLYYNFYQTLGHEQQIILLRKEVALDMVDMPLYNRVKEKMAEKQAIPKIVESEIKNYFEPY